MLKRKTTIGLGFALFGAVCAASLAGSFMPYNANAETEKSETALTEENSTLFLPSSYDQYLPLSNPTYMAKNEKYTVVADGVSLYIYDATAAKPKYEVYTANLPSGVSISKVQFAKGNRLFYSATNGSLYEYNFETGYSDLCVYCNSFLVVDDYVFTVQGSYNTYIPCRYPLSNLNRTGEHPIGEGREFTTVPKLAYEDGKLYYVVNNMHIDVYENLTENQPTAVEEVAIDDRGIPMQIPDLKFACAFGGNLYYTVNGDSKSYPNGLYRTDFEGHATLMIEGDGFSAIDCYDGKLYCVQGSSVLQLEETEQGVKPSGYEIGASSLSENRLMGAVDAFRSKDLLLIADGGAQRISVYDYSKQAYSTINCGFAPSLVSTDGNVIAVASGSEIYTCTYGEGKPELTLLQDAKTTVRGIACVYGNIYYVTATSVYGLAGTEKTNSFEHSAPSRMARDLYGNLFVSYEDGSVYSFTEEGFLTGEGVRLNYTLPLGHTSLRSDFEGNLYCLLRGTVYKNGEKFANINGNDFVYHTEDGVRAPTTFALGFRDSEVYFLFGDFGVKSKADVLDIPTLDRIAAEESREGTFSVHDTEKLFIDIPKGDIGILIDLDKYRAEESSYFPYADYARREEDARGVLLASTEKYQLVLLCENRVYTAALFRRHDERVVTEGYWQEESGSFYLSSNVSSYYAPTLAPQLSSAEKHRGDRVTVLGYVTASDYAGRYALVEYESETRAVETGYVPASFLTTVSPLLVSSDSYLTGFVKANEEGVLFTAEDGETTVTVTERTPVRLYAQEDGTYHARLAVNSKTYYANLEEEQIDWKQPDAVRIALIVTLSVLALVIIGSYVFLMSKNAKKSAAEKKQTNSEKKS